MEEQELPYEILSNCFFIVDDYGDAETPHEERLLLFYPNSEHKLKQSLLAQAIRNMTNFMRSFQEPEKPTSIMTLMNVKFAIYTENKFTFAVSAPIEESDCILEKHITTICEAFRFYWGPIIDIQRKFGNEREEFKKCIIKDFEVVIPLLRSFNKQRELNQNQWISIGPPKLSKARFFMQASGILSALQTEEDVFGGCMFYSSSVFCTLLNTSITNWIINFVEYYKTKNCNGLFSSQKAKRESKYIFLMPIFIESKHYTKYLFIF